MRRVVVTGLGPIAPNGIGKDAFHEAQLAGKSGIRSITRFDASKLYSQIAGEVDIDLEQFLDKRESKRLDRFTQLGMAAASLAVEDSGILGNIDLTRAGTIIGTGIGGMNSMVEQTTVMNAKGADRVSPLFIPTMIANMCSGHVAMRYGFMGPTSTIVTACSTGSDAIGSAARCIQLDEADVMIAGGTEAVVIPLAIGAFGVMKALSPRNDSPETASRPFSASRNGFVLSEGAAVVVLEEYNHAVARGATIYAEVVGFGRSADAHHITEPHPEGKGAALAMKAALRDAKINPEDVGYINAHGTSTPVGDKAETNAIKLVFGDHAYKLSVSSTKSMIGHLLGAAGSIEAIACVQALASGVLPPTINLHDQDPELDLDYIPNTPKEKVVDYVLSNSFAFGGLNASLVFKRV